MQRQLNLSRYCGCRLQCWCVALPSAAAQSAPPHVRFVCAPVKCCNWRDIPQCQHAFCARRSTVPRESDRSFTAPECAGNTLRTKLGRLDGPSLPETASSLPQTHISMFLPQHANFTAHTSCPHAPHCAKLYSLLPISVTAA